MALRYRRRTFLIPMELLLLRDVDGTGEKYQIIRLPQDEALKLLSQRAALVATPMTRRRYEKQIRKRAEASLPLKAQ